MLNHCHQKKHKFSFQKEISFENILQENSTPMFTHTISDTGKTIINKGVRTRFRKCFVPDSRRLPNGFFASGAKRDEHPRNLPGIKYF